MEILIVDDSRTMRMLVQRAIRQADIAGVHFSEADNGRAALEYLRGAKPAVILADWNMPEMDGIEFLHELRENGDETPFGFITSESSAAIAERASVEGADFLITKPFTADDLRSVLTRFVRA